MGLLNYTEAYRPTDSSGRADDELKNARAEATREFTIQTDTPMTPIAVRYAAQLAGWIPRKGEPHPDNLWHYCNAVECNTITPYLFRARAGYITMPGAEDGEDPALQPAEIRWYSTTTDEPIDQDAVGKPICTIVGEQFDPPLSRRVSDLFVTVTKNIAGFNPPDVADILDHVNSDTIFNFPPGTGLVETFEAPSVVTPDYTYFRRTIGIHFRRGAPNTTDAKAWYTRVRAEGFYFNVDLGGGNKVLGRAIDKTGQPVVKPVLHDKVTGLRINDPADAQWYEWRNYLTTPLGGLI